MAIARANTNYYFMQTTGEVFSEEEFAERAKGRAGLLIPEGEVTTTLLSAIGMPVEVQQVFIARLGGDTATPANSGVDATTTTTYGGGNVEATAPESASNESSETHNTTT